MSKNKTEPLVVHINKKLKAKFKSKVASEGTNMKDKVSEMLKKYTKQ